MLSLFLAACQSDDGPDRASDEFCRWAEVRYDIAEEAEQALADAVESGELDELTSDSERGDRLREVQAKMIEHAPPSLSAEVHLVLTIDLDSDDIRDQATRYGESLKAMNDVIRSDCDPAFAMDESNETPEPE